jgi:hypothetical protein
VKNGFQYSAALLALALASGHPPGGRIVPPTIEIVERDTPIAESRGALAAVEPHVAIDARDADHVVIGAIVVGPGTDDPWHCAALTTRDGGRTWTRTDFPMQRCIDPWITMLPDDRVLFTGIEIRRDDAAAEGVSPFRLVQFRSRDGGRRWSAQPDTLGRAHDHAMVATLPEQPDRMLLASRRMRRTAEGRERHTLYVAHLDTTARLRDWAELRPSNLAQNATGLAPLPSGEVVLTSWDFQRDVDGYGREGMLDRARAWAFHAPSVGAPFSEASLITDDCASGIEGAFPGYPALAHDGTGGSRAGWLYHACVRPGLDGIAVVRSEDKGETWSNPVRLAAPEVARAAHARTPMLAVGRDGSLGVAWYDRSADATHECQHVYFTASTDGARTFAPPVRVSTDASCPDGPENGRAARSWPMGGDYGSLAAAPDGSFRFVWADSRGRRFHLRTAVLRVAGD